MSGVYRVHVKRPLRRRLAALLLAAGALCLCFALWPPSPRTMRIERVPGVLVTQEITLPGQQLSLVCFGADADEACAMAISARFAHRGAAGALWQADGLYHAVGAVFFDPESAEAHAHALSQAEGLPAQPLLQEMPACTLRVTATRQQISALTDADAALLHAARQLSGIAMEIDSGNTDLAGAHKAVSALHSRLDSARTLLVQSIDGEREPASRALAALMREQADALAALSDVQTSSRLQFSSAVRALGVDILRSACAWRQSAPGT